MIDDNRTGKGTNHMFTPFHESLVDNLAGIVFPCLDVNSLLHDRIGAAAKSLSGPILRDRGQR